MTVRAAARVARATTSAALFLMLAAGCGLEQRATDEGSAVTPHASGWQYRWGDSPRDASGKLGWLAEEATGWTGFVPPSRPPGRNGAEFLWVRTRLPESAGPATVGFLRYVDLSFEAYVGDDLVYRYGSLDGRPQAPVGRPWHVFGLGAEPQGRHLTLRIWSDHGTIGPFGRLYLGQEQAILRALFKSGVSELILGALCLAMAGCALTLLAFNRRSATVLQLAGLAASCGLYAFTTSFSPLKQVLADAPELWLYVNLGSEYLVPAFYFGIYATMISGRLERAANAVRWCYVGFAACALGGAALGLFPLISTAPFGSLLLAAGMLFGLITSVQLTWRGSSEARWFLAGLSCAVFTGLHDIMVDERLITAERHLAAYGLFGFAGFIGLYLARANGRVVSDRAAMADQLARRNQDLVEARRRIAQAAGQVGLEGDEILRAASNTVDRTIRQREANVRTSTTVAQIAQASRQVAERAAETIAAAERHEGLARDGRQAVEDSATGMERLAEQVRVIARRADSLSEHGKRIGEIVDTVREISDRSAILAVNASLEAARAGDAGTGFAVVAREIRTLAEQSRESAIKVNKVLQEVGAEISAVLHEIDAGRQGAGQAGALARRAGEAIAGLATAIEGSARSARQIAEGTREQSQGLDEIVSAVDDGASAVEAALAETRRIELEARKLSELSAQLREVAETA